MQRAALIREPRRRNAAALDAKRDPTGHTPSPKSYAPIPRSEILNTDIGRESLPPMALLAWQGNRFVAARAQRPTDPAAEGRFLV